MKTDKKCRLENCNAIAGDHMFYDSTLCKEHAYDDEIFRKYPKVKDASDIDLLLKVSYFEEDVDE